MDDVVWKCAKRHLKDPANLSFVDSRIIQRTYGFEYERHFRPMLMRVLGIIKLEEVERDLDPMKLYPMQSTLNILKLRRDQEAHTHLKGATRRLDAPSVTKSRFITVYDGLKDIEKCIRKL